MINHDLKDYPKMSCNRYVNLLIDESTPPYKYTKLEAWCRARAVRIEDKAIKRSFRTKDYYFDALNFNRLILESPSKEMERLWLTGQRNERNKIMDMLLNERRLSFKDIKAFLTTQ